MKMIILTSPHQKPLEIEMHLKWYSKIGLLFIGICLVAYWIWFDVTDHDLRRQNAFATLSSVEGQVDRKFDEMQLRLESVAKRLDTLTQLSVSVDPVLPKIIALANQQKQENQMGGPLILTNRSLEDEGFAVRFDLLQRQIADLEHHVFLNENAINTERTQTQMLPVSLPIAEHYSITSPFGYRLDPQTKALSLHNGVDISAPAATNFIATASGTVTQASMVSGYGLLIEIQHANGFITRYGHASKLLVHIGDTVEKGQVIGLVGNTGRSTGNHLHYEVLYGGQSIDPEKLMHIN